MEFDWSKIPFKLDGLTTREIEESFEDPFALKILPDEELIPGKSRYLCLGKTLSNRGLFTLFWTDGKLYRAIFSRPMSPNESAFYERKLAELL
jgi:uncharacterized protein